MKRIIIGLVLLAGVEPSAVWAADKTQPPTARFERTLFYSDGDMNLVYDIKQGNFDADPDLEVLIVGGDGPHIVDMQGKQKGFHPFQQIKGNLIFRMLGFLDQPWKVSCVELHKGHPFSFLGNLPDVSQTVLYNLDGTVRWHIRGAYYQTTIAGDLDGDHDKEIVVDAKEHNIGVLDSLGNRIRTISEPSFPTSLCVADVDGDGKDEIVTSSLDTREKVVWVLDGYGHIKNKWGFPGPFYRFSTMPWTNDTKMAILFLSGDAFRIHDAEGQLLALYKAPSGSSYSKPIGTLLQRDGKETRVIFVADTHGSAHRHLISVFALTGELLYQHTGDDNAMSILVLTNTPASSFLVGSRNKVWRYTENK